MSSKMARGKAWRALEHFSECGDANETARAFRVLRSTLRATFKNVGVSLKCPPIPAKYLPLLRRTHRVTDIHLAAQLLAKPPHVIRNWISMLNSERKEDDRIRT